MESVSDKTVWMIGHSKHPLSAFVGLLRSHEISLLVDVRSSPRSRYPWFEKARLRNGLRASEIEYWHCAKLGGKPALPLPKVRDLLDYFLPPKQRMCFMCSEGDYLQCHRHYHLARVIVPMGYTVLQIQRDGSTVEDLGPSRKTLTKFAQYIPGYSPAPAAKQNVLF